MKTKEDVQDELDFKEFRVKFWERFGIIGTTQDYFNNGGVMV